MIRHVLTLALCLSIYKLSADEELKGFSSIASTEPLPVIGNPNAEWFANNPECFQITIKINPPEPYPNNVCYVIKDGELVKIK